MIHYRANVNHRSTQCFKHFDNEENMFAWVSEIIGEKVNSYEECEKWTRRQDVGIAHTNGYIEVLEILDIKEFYKLRREYVTYLRKCDDLLFRAQRMKKSFKRDRVLDSYSSAYQGANDLYWDYPQVWQGEI